MAYWYTGSALHQIPQSYLLAIIRSYYGMEAWVTIFLTQ